MFDCQKSSLAQILLSAEAGLLPVKDRPNTFKSFFCSSELAFESSLVPQYQFKEWLHC